MINKNIIKGAALLMMATSLSGCGMWSKLTRVGQEPPLSPITNPVEAEGYRPVSMPMPEQKVQKQAANSLWHQGADGFFKDQRAAKVGDIITVKVSAQDTALMENEMEQNRDDNKDSIGVGSFFGYESYLDKVFPHQIKIVSGIECKANDMIFVYITLEQMAMEKSVQ